MKRYPSLHSHTFYHIYNRGVSKQKIFLIEADYRYFMYKLAIFKHKYYIKMIKFCVMPNHFHLLIYTQEKPKNISLFMKGLQYTCAFRFNKKYKHSGHVFESCYKIKSIPAEDLPKIINYIEQNPVRKGLVMRAEDWPYKG
ncbi:transposase [Candidatus Peregrinibacteria bacterium]|nr:transposase [Candidatus Peregrinibacteria bacterium]